MMPVIHPADLKRALKCIHRLADGKSSGKIGTKTVDENNIGDERILQYKDSSGNVEYCDKPTGGEGGTPSSTVVSETTFGQSSTAGTSSDFQRGDHSHGTPADPVPAHQETYNHGLLHSNSLDHLNTNDPSADQKAALSGTSGTPGSDNKYVTNADSRNSDARTPVAHNQAFSTISATPTTLGGYGITDAAPLSHTLLTTSAHGGIVADGDARLSDARTPTVHDSAKHSVAYEDANSNIQAHVTGTGSPHTAAGVGAEVSGAVSTHDGLSGPHATATSVGGKNIPSGGIADAGTLSTHTSAATPHSGHENTANKGGVSGYCGLDASSKALIANLPTGATSSTVCIGNDSRLSDARTPLAHVHAASDVSSGELDGDRLPAISTSKKGGVPATGAASGKFLKDDGTWAAPAGGGESENVIVATQDTANATTTLANATGLVFAADAASTYLIEGFIVWDSSVTTVGIKLSATGPSTPTVMAGHFITDAAKGTPDSSSFNGNDVTVTTSASAFTSGNIAALHCILKTGANSGNFQIRFAAETTGTVTIKIGSVLRYRKVA